MTKIKGIIFDMDGVLTETSEYHYMAWKLLASSIDIHIDREFSEQLKGVSRMESLEIILKHGGREHDFSEAEKLTLATKKNSKYVEMISQFSRRNLFDGVYSLLVELKKRNIKIGVASNSKSVKRLVKLLEIEAFVDYIVDPGSVPGKPSPDIFLQACKGLKLKPNECIAIEDSKIGIEAIKAAKIYAVGIGDSLLLNQADCIYPTTKDINIEALLSH